MDLDVVGIGYPCVDIVARVDHLPHDDESLPMQDYTLQGGGKVSTALVTLSRLGDNVGIVGKIGDDFNGNFIKKDFKKHEVDISNLKVEKNSKSPFSIVLSNSNSKGRSIIWEKGTLDPYKESEFNIEYIKKAKYIHMAKPNELELKIASKLKDDRETKIIYDGDFYETAVLDLLPYLDVLIASRGFADDFAKEEMKSPEDYKEIVELLSKKGPNVVIITLGKKGAIGLADGRLFDQPAFEVDVVDTTGAGDVYHGAFIHGLLENNNVEESAKFAGAVAALKSTGLGGRANIPTKRDVEEFLATGKAYVADGEERKKYYKKWLH